MLAIPAALIGLSEQQTKRLATAWSVERRDGVTLRFTSHDRALAIQGNTYDPAGGFNASARRHEAGLKTHDTEFAGVISSGRITDADLLAGRYRDAKVTEMLVDWKYAWPGPLASWVYWIGDVTFDGEVWQAQVEGQRRWLDPKVGDVYARTCVADLGDAECAVNLATYTVSGVHPIGLLDGPRRRIIRANSTELSGTYPDGYFAYGEVQFTSGANNGLKGQVKGYTQATRDIELHLEMPFAIATTDTFSIIAGCNKLVATCVGKFNNIKNNRSFPFIPGSDRVLKTHP